SAASSDYNQQLLHTFALLQQPPRNTAPEDNFDFVPARPNLALQISNEAPTVAASGWYANSYPTPDTSGASVPFYGDWQMQSSMGVPAVPYTPGSLKRARGHQRTPSASTVGSNGPSSPYAYSNYAHPLIANTDFAPQSPALFADQAGGFSKGLPTSVEGFYMGTAYMPSVAAHTAGAHEAMKGFAIDHHNGEGFAAQYPQPTRQSMSSHGNSSPATPPTSSGEAANNGRYAPTPNDAFSANPNVQLWRSESQAYQDELYNPPTTEYAAASTSTTKPTTSYLTPHRNLMTERLQTANLARSHSPTGSMSRERSPFRDNSPLAPTQEWRSPAQSVGTAASMRQQQKERMDRAELAQHMPQLNREATKTISPKDALLDYNEQEQPSLFQDSIPAGYKQHTSGTELWPNNFCGQPGSSFGTLQTPSQQPSLANFRATPADGFAGTDPMSFQPLPLSDSNQLQSTSYMNPYVVPKMESNPEFPAHLTTMESSMSDNPPQSSQDSAGNIAVIQRPADTRAATGTYTCTYHGCTQRFDSHANLQKHKRDLHRAQQHSRDNSGASGGAASSGSASRSASPRSTESPGPSSTSGMTSAELMARNSQAGPHKCTRTNPSTNKPCNTIFSRPYDLTRHEDTIHNGRKQKVRCPMCREEKTFSRTDALTRHMRVVHPEVEAFGKRGKRGV
ncbi:hypothetical protein LTR53_016535, partial [Teratosphaeriaceae sp. CCFEE 6253]